LKKLYCNPQTGLSSAQQLYINANKNSKIVTLKQVKEWLAKQEHQQVFSRKKKLFNAIIGGPDDYQMDIMFFLQYKKQNDGYDAIVNFINITSRKAYSYAIKGKKQAEFNRVFDLFYNEVDNRIVNITSDNKASFKSSIKRYPAITHYQVDPNDKTKTGIVERFNRTLRSKIDKYLKLHKTKTWYKALPELVSNYNSSKHSTILKAPNDVTDKDVTKIRSAAFGRGEKAREETNNFEVGDSVRILKNKKVFEKGTEKWSAQLYTIDSIDKLSFKIKTTNGVLLKRNYKNWQLKKANDTEHFTPPKIEEQHSSKVVRTDNKFKKLNIKSGIGDKLDEDNQPILINPRMKPTNVKRFTTKAPIQEIIPQKPKTEPEKMKPVIVNNKPSIGKKVSLKWDDGIWYDGTITKILKGGLVTVSYDDGDVQNHRLLEKSKDISWKFI
jgi:hypothetical protein